MPLIAHNKLPSFARLADEGYTILQEGRAITQDIRELHIGLLNMMPDSALQATERQFLRLIGESNKIAQIYVHPFTLPELERGKETKAYIKEHYESFENIKKEGLDALIITGANVIDPDLTKNAFWKPLQEVLDWSYNNVTSTICSCLATHAYMEFHNNQKRHLMKNKLWGVYKHRVLDRYHPLVRDMNTIFDVPHSRNNTITSKQFEKAKMKILVAGEKAGVHMATSTDGFRIICFQGHPEYDTISLLKEYKREVALYADGERKKYPPFPQYYFNKDNEKILKAYKQSVKQKKTLPSFPEETLEPLLENTWRDSGRAIISNWIGLVYQITNIDRKKQFMNDVNKDDPLGLKS